MRRQAGKLRQLLPFTALAVTDREQQASDHRPSESLGNFPELPKGDTCDLATKAAVIARYETRYEPLARVS